MSIFYKILNVSGDSISARASVIHPESVQTGPGGRLDRYGAKGLAKIVNGLSAALEILEQWINRFNQPSATVLLPAKTSNASYYDSER